ncbi:putative heterokaryon incompatibility protein [Phaeoacremonium minimum UCRPA7]|uniref:Putative heterokaryon incompatibility protein n=1 Tax=Phaeoacremonium minimum (strain UCR-PA7) TaxID=1286976 RepID=R8BV27_PHAM7|nr:putative heterokaryon incompatibility protein [Phaeoacremonium minimum UCRPA7]EOO03226.1 putative heterokaryon incompatibility protein [Phaeoacremonium minimum UCRPA7]
MPFTYPPLPATDGLRILTLQPTSSGFLSRLTGSLTAVAFSSKPKYIALSYTWADPDEAHEKLPLPRDSTNLTAYTKSLVDNTAHPGVIMLNNEPFPIGHNLTLALHHVRSDTEPVHIWVDQICIDQASIPERNAQVALMAFIFTRAAAVVGWLGVEARPPSGVELPDYMALRWESGRGKQLAKLALPVPAKGRKAVPWKLQYSNSSTGVSFKRDNPYWQRLWIVQEVCLPRTVVFLHGGYLWSQGQVRDSLKIGSSAGRVAENAIPVDTLLSTRDERFSEAMSLEILVEKFADCGCSDLRDKLYGLLGLANDVESAPASAVVSQAAANGQAEKKGRGTIVIDYNRSFWDIFCDIMTFMSTWSKPHFDPCPSCPDQTDEERWIRTVRFAGVVQNALQGKVEEDARNADSDGERLFATAKGYIAGKIQHIGPKYSKFISSYAEEQAWVSSWHEYYSSADDLLNLRKMEDAYAAKIIDYSEHDLAHIRGYARSRAVVWHAARSKHCHNYDSEMNILQKPGEDPVRFLGTEHCMGLAPPNAEPGDLVIRFWNCDAAIIVRQQNAQATKEVRRLYCLVGRADIAEPWDREVGPDVVGRDYMAIHEDESTLTFHDCSSFHVATDKAVYVKMDYETLQKITADICT